MGKLSIPYKLGTDVGDIQIEIFFNPEFEDHEVCVRFSETGYTTANDGKLFKDSWQAKIYAQDLFSKYNRNNQE